MMKVLDEAWLKAFPAASELMIRGPARHSSYVETTSPAESLPPSEKVKVPWLAIAECRPAI